MSDSPPLFASLPKHIAVIMDGNARWARAKGVPTIEGHRQGIEALKTSIRVCCSYGIHYLTVFGFSDDNWRRQKHDVQNLMNLLRHVLRDENLEWKRQGVRLRVIGDKKRLGRDIAELIALKEKETQKQKTLNLTIALSYSGRKDILQALCRLTAGQTPAQALMTEETLQAMLWTSFMPDPDLLIRTSGEMRLSNFMLWQTAYTELYFTETLWPDFDEVAMYKALASYAARHRRYGA